MLLVGSDAILDLYGRSLEFSVRLRAKPEGETKTRRITGNYKIFLVIGKFFLSGKDIDK